MLQVFDEWTDGFARHVATKGKVAPGEFRACGYRPPAHLWADLKTKWRGFRMALGVPVPGTSPAIPQEQHLNRDATVFYKRREGKKLRVWTSLCLLGAAATVDAQQPPPTPAMSGIQVQFVEGTVHGFLRLSTADGKPLANGDLLQVVRDSVVESRMMFTLADSSVFEETVSFTQRGTFRMLEYRLVQRGRAFAADLDVTLSHTGRYRVASRSRKDGERKEYAGKLELPPDTYNGMIVTIAKNLPVGAPRKVHLVAFTPKPRLIGLELTGETTAPTAFGSRKERTVRFTLEPKLGTLVGIFARLLGQMPPDSYIWIVTEDVPAFIRFEGPMYVGPVWRLELASPR